MFETIMTIAIVLCLKSDWLYRLEQMVKSGYKKSKSTADGAFAKLIELLEEDYASIVVEVAKIFRESASSLTAEELLQIIIPAEILNCKKPETFQAVNLLLKKQTLTDADINAFYNSMEEVIQEYFSSRKMPQLDGYAQNSSFNSTYDKEAVSVGLVGLYMQQFFGSILQLSQSTQVKDVNLCEKVRKSYTQFMHKVVQSPILGKCSLSETMSLRQSSENNVFMLLQNKSDELMAKLDQKLQANRKTQVIEGLKNTCFEWQRLTHSLLLRMSDKYAINSRLTISASSIIKGSLEQQAKVDWEGKIPFCRPFEFVSWVKQKFDLSNPITKAVKKHAEHNQLHTQNTGKFIDLLDRYESNTKPVKFSGANAPELMNNKVLTEPDYQDFQRIAMELLQTMDLRQSLLLEFEKLQHYAASGFYQGNEQQQWLAILNGLTQKLINLQQDLFASNYCNYFESRLDPVLNELTKGKIALDRQVSELLACPDETVIITPNNPFYTNLAHLSVGPSVTSPCYHERVKLKQSMADFCYWLGKTENRADERHTQFNRFSSTELDLVLLMHRQRGLYQLVDQNALKSEFTGLYNHFQAIQQQINEFNALDLHVPSNIRRQLNSMSWFDIKNKKVVFVTNTIKSYESVQHLLQQVNQLSEWLSITQGQQILAGIKTHCRTIIEMRNSVLNPDPQEQIIAHNEQMKLHWFQVVHSALYQSQGVFKCTRVDKNSLARIQTHIQNNPNSRSAIAMRIVQNLILGCPLNHTTIVAVFKEIYQHSREHGLFRTGRKLAGQNIHDFASLTVDNIKHLAESDAGSRTYKIMQALGW